WLAALKRTDGPTALVLSRQDLPQLAGSNKLAEKGAYIISPEKGEQPALIIMASGSEVRLALEAQEALWEQGADVRVVSMVSWEMFLAQDEAYREKVLPAAVRKRLAVEAGRAMGWQQFAGCEGAVIAMEQFGASAPGEVLMEKYGFTVENIVRQALELLAR
ncbi:MAG: transketolase, partial [Firmicutes bacterium]|nr:transketolase [Bacillota bacterium]